MKGTVHPKLRHALCLGGGECQPFFPDSPISQSVKEGGTEERLGLERKRGQGKITPATEKLLKGLKGRKGRKGRGGERQRVKGNRSGSVGDLRFTGETARVETRHGRPGRAPRPPSDYSVDRFVGNALSDGRQHASVHKELLRVAVQDARFLEDQLGVYEPDLIVCCGKVVTDYLKREVGWASNLGWQTTTRGVDYAAIGPGSTSSRTRIPKHTSPTTCYTMD